MRSALEWAQVKALAADGLSQRQIAARLGINRRTVSSSCSPRLRRRHSRTTVYLPDGLKAALERTAAAQGKSEAEILRAALAVATEEHAYPPPTLPLFDSRDATLAERVDEELAGGFGA